MARFILEPPAEVVTQMKQIYGNTTKIFGDMTRAGADVAMLNVKSRVPLPEMAAHVKLSKTYRTPSDGGINTKVYFSGYLPFSGNRKTFVRKAKGKVYVTDKGVPAGFLAQIYEYGRSEPKFTKKPFFRKAFKKAQIEQAMLEAQKKSSGGLLV